jgi:hypothetical protein
MMFASHYMSEWTSVLSLCEMPIRSGVGARDRAKSRAGTGLVAAHIGGLCVRDNYGWRSKDRRYERTVKCQVNDARLKAAATNSTATSNSEPTSTPAASPFSNFAFAFSASNLYEVKNEKLQH